MRTIEIEPYCDGWPKLYETEARKIQLFLGTNCLSTYHIGSTAIEGMSAKPIIDILVEARNIEDIDLVYENFEELGYISKGEYGIEGRRFFHKGEEIRTHHIHFFEASNPELQRHKYFVEFLSCHPEWAK